MGQPEGKKYEVRRFEDGVDNHLLTVHGTRAMRTNKAPNVVSVYGLAGELVFSVNLRAGMYIREQAGTSELY